MEPAVQVGRQLGKAVSNLLSHQDQKMFVHACLVLPRTLSGRDGEMDKQVLVKSKDGCIELFDVHGKFPVLLNVPVLLAGALRQRHDGNVFAVEDKVGVDENADDRLLHGGQDLGHSPLMAVPIHAARELQLVVAQKGVDGTWEGNGRRRRR